jgi:hypothetical protein
LGADNTDDERNDFGWRVEIFVDDSTTDNSAVNILAAKLREAAALPKTGNNAEKAVITLGRPGGGWEQLCASFARGNLLHITFL